MSRRATTAVISASGAAAAACAILLATASLAGAEDSPTTGTTPGVTTPTDPALPPTGTTPTPLPPPAPKLIAAGVTVGGTLVGGLTAAEAKEIVRERFGRQLTLTTPGAQLQVTPQQLGAAAHLNAAIKLAARVKRPGFVVPLKVDVTRAKVERLVAGLGRTFHRSPVDAQLKLHNLRPFATRDVPGRRLKELIATREIVYALKTQDREPLRIPFEEIAADVTSNDLGRAIVIRRGSNLLYLYDVKNKPKLLRTFRVATGQSSYPTPLGKFEVVVKQLHPWWYPPAGSDWAKDSVPIPPGPGNPLGTRWMGLTAPYVGIHGTPDAASIGYSASHGCIRMLIPEVEWLFTKVDVGTPVFIVGA